MPNQPNAFAADTEHNMRGQLTTIDAIQKFILAGNATITLVSRRTGQRYTYRIKQAQDNDGSRRQFWFVALLSGQDNESDYHYIGYINKDLHFIYGQKSNIGRTSPSVRAFTWFYECVDINEPETRDRLFAGVEVWHEGKCGRCGRKLTVPSSIEQGFGPECVRFV